MHFNWHGGAITRATVVDKAYKNTQNVRRFFLAECGKDFSFDRDFMQWMRDGASKSMGQAADEWCKRRAPRLDEATAETTRTPADDEA